MLQHFSWQQFLVAALILTLIWYTGLILLFYRDTITDLLNGRRRPASVLETLPHVWDEDYENEPISEEEESLMGKSVLPEGMTRLSMAQFGFAPIVENATNEKRETGGERDMQLGLVPDVLEELKSIFHILHTENGNKVDFISLFKMVSSKYPKIRNTPNQHALNDYIRENLPFEITEDELDKLWI